MSKRTATMVSCGGLWHTFVMMFPDLKDQVTYFGPNDYSSIRIETVTKHKLIFEYINDKEWCLSTEHSYYNSHSKQPS